MTSFSIYTLEETPESDSSTTTPSSSSGGGVPTYTIREDQFNEGYTKSIGRWWKLKFNLKNETHEVKIDALTNSTIKIIISSEPQEATLAVGDERKFDLTNDSFYDLSVRLNSIKGLRTNLTIQSIHEGITSETIGEEDEKEDVAGEVYEEEKTDWVLIIGFVVLLIVVFWVFYFWKVKNYKKK